MFKVLLSALVAFSLVLGSTSITSAAGGKGGSGGGGGGSVKPVTFRITGAISKIEPAVGGVKVTIGTSYYATGSAIITSNSKMRLNGVQDGITPYSYMLGDYAEIDLTQAGLAYKIEAVR